MRTIKRKYLQLQSCLLHQMMIQVKTLMKTMMSSPLQLLCQSLLCQRRKLIVLILMIAALMKTMLFYSMLYSGPKLDSHQFKDVLGRLRLLGRISLSISCSSCSCKCQPYS